MLTLRQTLVAPLRLIELNKACSGFTIVSLMNCVVLQSSRSIASCLVGVVNQLVVDLHSF